MPEKNWPAQRRVIGTRVQRLDGPVKAVGSARYGYDINRKGMLHAMILRCPFAHARIRQLDVSAAEKTPGFKAVYQLRGVGDELFYAGQEILAIAADSEEHCADAIRAVKVEYERLEAIVREEDALRRPTAGTTPNSQAGNVRFTGLRSDGDVDAAFWSADAVVEGVYSVAVQVHSCLESHGLAAEWDGDDLTVWASTQAVPAIAAELRAHFQRDQPHRKGFAAKVKCITHYMGGGYGSKFNAGFEGIAAAELARIAKAPVKLFVDRAEEQATMGFRPSATAIVRIAGQADGTIVAFAADTYGTPGGGGGAAGVDGYHSLLPYVYSVKNVRNQTTSVRLNTADRRALRAPGHPQACFITESAVEDLATALGIDPIAIRLKNLPADLRKPIYEKQLEIVKELCGWDKRWHPPGKGPSRGPVKHGLGIALHTWAGGGRPNNDVKVTISANGGVLVQCSTQDLGTGQRTVLAIVVAEVFGLNPKEIAVEIGDSSFGRSTASGGSTTCPGTAPAALNAAAAARTAFFEKIAPKLGVPAENLTLGVGEVRAGDKKWTWKEAAAKLGMEQVVGTGDHSPGLSSMTVGGVQVAEVWVDTETGVVRCSTIWAVQDCGMVINKLACESQVAGGVIMGVNYALFEERLMDQQTGRMVNPDMEFYKLGGIQDMPEIVIHMIDMPERGVIGIGEPPTISTAAAIGNAIANATGKRVGTAPFTPARVLARLARKEGINIRKTSKNVPAFPGPDRLAHTGNGGYSA